MAHVAHGQPFAVAQRGRAIARLAHIVHEQHGAAHVDQAVLARLQGLVAGLLRGGADLQLHIAEGPAHGLGRGLFVGLHPGDEAGLRGAVELDDACARKQRAQGRGLGAHPARAADHDQLHLGDGRQRAVCGPLQHQQQLAGHGDQAGGFAARQRGQAARCREPLLHHGAFAAPQALHHAEQEQRMRDAPGRHGALRGHGAEVLEADAKALCPRTVVAHEALGQSGAARGEAGIEGAGGSGFGQRAGRGGKPAFDALAHGLGPIRVGHGGAAAAVQDGEEFDDGIHGAGAAARVHQQHLWRLAGHQRGRALQHGGMQRGKAPLARLALQRHRIGALPGPMLQRAMDQGPRVLQRRGQRVGRGWLSHAGGLRTASPACRAPPCAPPGRTART